MKRTCIIFFFVMAIVFKIHAHAHTEVFDTVIVLQKKTEKKLLTKKSQRLRGRNVDYDDCAQCDSLMTVVKKEKESLEKQLNDLKTKLGNTNAILDIDDGYFYRSLILTPLTEKYDSILVDCYIKTVSLFDHENKIEMRRVYELYFPMLNNYEQYNQDLIRLIKRIITSFNLLSSPDPDNEKNWFNQGLEEMEYFKKYRYKSNIHQEIRYLEDVINDTKTLFDDPAKFKKEYFDEQLKKLEH